MPRPKKTEAKEPVKLRQRKLDSGNTSLYLDCCLDGKRTYEFLHMYLIPEKSTQDRKKNAATLEAANTIRLQRILEMNNRRAGLKSVKAKMMLSKWFDTYCDMMERKGARGLKLLRSTKRLFEIYDKKARLCDIDRKFCIDFIDWIQHDYKTQFGNPLAAKSIADYLGYFTTALNAAVREELMYDNPMLTLSQDERPSVPESQREFLTIEEVNKLIKTPCGREDVKRAYLLCVFSGLRISDVERLRWKDISKDGDQYRLNIVMVKTRTPLYVPLSDESLKWLPMRPEDAKDDDIIFNTLPSQVNGCMHLKEWAKNAGVMKKITYHTGRHTFATMMLTLGVDLYTVSKLLGHSNVKTTQIYAKIINKKKDDAVNLVNGLFD
ncbi:MAG: site-specific integrase [Muribaculaceae bacterium]|nr:site-specific integrase [Muribaculaceae bacterium]